MVAARIRSREPDVPEFNPGEIVAHGLATYTFGFPREQIRSIQRRPPDSITPEQVARLDPLTIPSSLPLPPPRPRVKDLSAAVVAASWADYQGAARQIRQHVGERSQRLLELGRLLAELQQQLAVKGRASTFRPQLRQIGIPRATAYRLIAAYHKSLKQTKDLNGLEVTESVPKQSPKQPPSAPPDFVLTPQSIYVYCDPKEATIAHFALKAYVPSPKRIAISEMVAAGFADHAPASLVPYLKQFWDASPGSPIVRKWRPRAPLRLYFPARPAPSPVAA